MARSQLVYIAMCCEVEKNRYAMFVTMTQAADKHPMSKGLQSFAWVPRKPLCMLDSLRRSTGRPVTYATQTDAKPMQTQSPGGRRHTVGRGGRGAARRGWACVGGQTFDSFTESVSHAHCLGLEHPVTNQTHRPGPSSRSKAQTSDVPTIHLEQLRCLQMYW
jgi:hypothetical protein